jgi:hypothetical protein
MFTGDVPREGYVTVVDLRGRMLARVAVIGRVRENNRYLNCAIVPP